MIFLAIIGVLVLRAICREPRMISFKPMAPGNSRLTPQIDTRKDAHVWSAGSGQGAPEAIGDSNLTPQIGFEGVAPCQGEVGTLFSSADSRKRKAQ